LFAINGDADLPFHLLRRAGKIGIKYQEVEFGKAYSRFKRHDMFASCIKLYRCLELILF
jgi:hypothetical protein